MNHATIAATAEARSASVIATLESGSVTQLLLPLLLAWGRVLGPAVAVAVAVFIAIVVANLGIAFGLFRRFAAVPCISTLCYCLLLPPAYPVYLGCAME